MANKYDFLNKIGLGNVWTNIKNYINSFTFSKSEINTKLGDKANSSDLNNYFPKSGGQLSGTNISRNVDNETLHLYGGIGYGHGAFLQLTGKDENGNGEFNIQANNGSVNKVFTGKPNGSLTWNNKNIDVIEEQGDGYIRYSNGLQICWGSISWKSRCSSQWGSLFETDGKGAVYVKSFAERPSVSSYGVIEEYFAMVECGGGTSTSTPGFALCRPKSITEEKNCLVYYTAIGRWK